MWKLALTETKISKSVDQIQTSSTIKSSPIFVYHIGRHGYRTFETTFKGIISNETQNFPYFDEIEVGLDDNNYSYIQSIMF